MAESMQGLHRSHRCTEVNNTMIGEEVTLMGWVQKRRNLGSLIFIDLRDRSGMMQVVFDEPVDLPRQELCAASMWLLSSARYRSVPQPSMRT